MVSNIPLRTSVVSVQLTVRESLIEIRPLLPIELPEYVKESGQ